jgi:hypothetical protein
MSSTLAVAPLENAPRNTLRTAHLEAHTERHAGAGAAGRLCGCSVLPIVVDPARR